jgi:hypothetical protein
MSEINPLNYTEQALNLFDRSIELGKKLKEYLTPQYKPAAKALFEITDSLMLATQSLLRWIHEFELMDLRQEDEKNFRKFAAEFSEFRNGPDFDKVKVQCTQIGAIYREDLEGKLKEWYAREKDKLAEAREHFEASSKVDLIVSEFINNLVGDLEKAINDVKVNYGTAETIQKTFSNTVGPVVMKLEQQLDKMRNLRNDFLSLASARIS